jgi:exopolyphosphatase/guanosine-5'-triphosphate,3'-diphosphate pyrophosphatase
VRALREAACWVSDIGSHDHPNTAAEQAFLRILRQHGAGSTTMPRLLGLCAALRYEAEPSAPFLGPTRVLLDLPTIRRAEALGGRAPPRLHALRRHAGAAGRHAPRAPGSRLVLRLAEGTASSRARACVRRVEQLGAVLGLEAVVEVDG